MSHDHRDEHELTEPTVEPPAPVVVTPPGPAVSNSETERRAAERRKLEGVGEQTTQHQFTGDLPEPDRGGTETETRIRFGDSDPSDEDALLRPAAATRRGPPAPRARHVGDEGSWAAPPTLDAIGTGSFGICTATWSTPAVRGNELRLVVRGVWADRR